MLASRADASEGDEDSVTLVPSTSDTVQLLLHEVALVHQHGQNYEVPVEDFEPDVSINVKIQYKTQAGRRKCTTERNKDKVSALRDAFLDLSTSVKRLMRHNMWLAAKMRITDAMLKIRENQLSLFTRVQQVKASTTLAESSSIFVLEGIGLTHSEVLALSTMNLSHFAGAVRSYTLDAIRDLCEYQGVACDHESLRNALSAGHTTHGLHSAVNGSSTDLVTTCQISPSRGSTPAPTNTAGNTSCMSGSVAQTPLSHAVFAIVSQPNPDGGTILHDGGRLSTACSRLEGLLQAAHASQPAQPLDSKDMCLHRLTTTVSSRLATVMRAVSCLQPKNHIQLLSKNLVTGAEETVPPDWWDAVVSATKLTALQGLEISVAMQLLRESTQKLRRKMDAIIQGFHLLAVQRQTALDSQQQQVASACTFTESAAFAVPQPRRRQQQQHSTNETRDVNTSDVSHSITDHPMITTTEGTQVSQQGIPLDACVSNPLEPFMTSVTNATLMVSKIFSDTGQPAVHTDATGTAVTLQALTRATPPPVPAFPWQVNQVHVTSSSSCTNHDHFIQLLLPIAPLDLPEGIPPLELAGATPAASARGVAGPSSGVAGSRITADLQNGFAGVLQSVDQHDGGDDDDDDDVVVVANACRSLRGEREEASLLCTTTTGTHKLHIPKHKHASPAHRLHGPLAAAVVQSSQQGVANTPPGAPHVPTQAHASRRSRQHDGPSPIVQHTRGSRGSSGCHIDDAHVGVLQGGREVRASAAAPPTQGQPRDHHHNHNHNCNHHGHCLSSHDCKHSLQQQQQQHRLHAPAGSNSGEPVATTMKAPCANLPDRLGKVLPDLGVDPARCHWLQLLSTTEVWELTEQLCSVGREQQNMLVMTCAFVFGRVMCPLQAACVAVCSWPVLPDVVAIDEAVRRMYLKHTTTNHSTSTAMTTAGFNAGNAFNNAPRMPRKRVGSSSSLSSWKRDVGSGNGGPSQSNCHDEGGSSRPASGRRSPAGQQQCNQQYCHSDHMTARDLLFFRDGIEV